MLFNTIEFAIFLPVVFILYWLLNKKIKLQNSLILVASYFFYGWWDWRFLSLIFFSSIVDFLISNKLEKTKEKKIKKQLLSISLIFNLGILMFFKYFNFFSESFANAFTLLGRPIEVSRLNIILPVGISFYTFQTLSYTIDVYRGKLKASNDIISFFAFVSFFPQLVAGPIERATNLLPQFYKKRVFNIIIAKDGIRQIIWGLFKKVVIADNCAVYVNDIFNNYQDFSSSTLIIGAILFAFQIYGDFSGYSDIAIGTAKLFGFSLMKNFNYPYFSRDIAEFWRRWHISLSTWFRDYLYIPLGGSRGDLKKKIRNIFIIFLVSGFWHGANWTFIIWGGLNALYFLPLMLMKKNRINTDQVAQGKLLPSLKESFGIISTFILTTLAWIFFRAESVRHAFDYIEGIFSLNFEKNSLHNVTDIFMIITSMLIIEWYKREKDHPLSFNESSSNSKKIINTIFISIIIWSIILWGAFDNKEFIYFDF